MMLTARDRAVLAFLVKAGTAGAAVRDISRGTPGGNAYPTLLRLNRLGMVTLIYEAGRFTGGAITADGLEAFILSGV